MLSARYGHAKTTSRLREPHTISRPDFAQVYLIWEFFLNRTSSGPPVSTESTFARPSLTTNKGLEEVYLLVFCVRKVRKMTKNAETAKNATQTVFDPRFLHTMLGRALGNRASKKNGKKKHINREVWPCEKRPPASENRIPFLGQISPRYT